MRELFVSYSSISGIIDTSYSYYRTVTDGYDLYLVTSKSIAQCSLRDASEISDFETNHKANCEAVTSKDDAIALGSYYIKEVTQPLELAIAFGLFSTMAVSRATGYTATSATTAKAIRATTYTPQGTDARRSIASSNANDTAAGTGARKVKITYLTASFVEKTETVTLNGTTGVNTTASDIAFIQKMEVTEVGTQGGGNAGTISIYTLIDKGGSVWGSIAAEDNSTYWAHHYVPANKTCYLISLSVGSTAVGGQATINRSGNPLTVTEPQRGVGGTYVHATLGNTEHPFRIPVSITGPDFIWLVERPIGSTSSTVFGTFEYIEF